MNFDDVIPAFCAEATELLREMEAGLLECAQGNTSDETINLIFRSAHTIKGSAGLFGLDAIVSFVHGVETMLDRVRQGELTLDVERAQSLLACKDHIEALVAVVADGQRETPQELLDRSQELLHRLGQAPAPSRSGKADADAAGTQSGATSTQDGWKIAVRFSPDVLMSGMDPLAFIRYLTTFGTITELTPIDEALPTLAELDPFKCYLGFDITLLTSEGRARVEAAFEFVKDDCTLHIEPFHAAPAQEAAASEATSAAEGTRSEGAPKSVQESGQKSGAGATVRVDAEKLDSLITRIGELIIAAAGANVAARRAGSAEVEESLSVLSSLVEEVRGSALQLRMVKIGATFARFRRVVHDVSRELGKEISLVVNGEDAELDKTLVERITDPLTHLVRNAIDHGIEPANVRLARGKPAAGTVRLNAFHDSGSIVIEVSDDGGGLNRDKILAKAQERGLIDPGRTLTDNEIYNLIFEPGFSTADKVTNLSGRGVGMDVVKRNITAMRGTVSIRSREGVGTTMSVRLPLTLAIIHGFQVGVGNSVYVLPLDMIEECVEFTSHTGHDFTGLRGEVLPFIRLREVFRTSGPVARRQSIVVVRHGTQRAGLVVDTLHGESQTVIKPLGRMFRQSDFVSGSSILGNGTVALILDVPALIERAISRSQAQARRASTAAA